MRALAAGESPPADKHQNWVLDHDAEAWRLDVMLDPGDAETWVFRRDPTLRAARSDVIAERDGIPYLAPEATLLFKATAVLPKAEADFEAGRPELGASARRWLIRALSRVHPGHAWIDRLR